MKGLRWCCAWCFLLISVLLPAQEKGHGERKLVKILNTDRVKSFPTQDVQGNRLIGHVQLLHNEALMTCDSAYFYSSSNRFEAFGHVYLSKNSTQLYGDTLYYDGNTNLARVRGKLIRLEDSSAILRTFNLDYNTKDDIAYFFGGGTLADKENVLESEKGYYYSNRKLAKFHGAAEMRNDKYDILSDSLHYYTQTETAVFLSHTSIWHADGFLSCQSGWYEQPKDYFHFAQEAYILSEQREMWADSIFHKRTEGISDLYGNIQVLDTAKSVLAFGDEAHMLNDPRKATITRNPSIAYFGGENNNKNEARDTVFLRADTLKFVAIKNPAFYGTDTLQTADTALVAAPIVNRQDSLLVDTLRKTDTTMMAPIVKQDSLSTSTDTLLQADTTRLAMPEVSQDTLLTDTVPKADTAMITVPEAIQDTLSTTILPQIDTAMVAAAPVVVTPDSVATQPVPPPEKSEDTPVDTVICPLLSLGRNVLDAWQKDLWAQRAAIPRTMLSPVRSDVYRKFAGDTTKLAGLPIDKTPPQIDSILQYFYAYRTVRVYRGNGQAACDSMIFFMNDTLTEMYYDPVLWSQKNQLTADKIRFISKEKALYRGEFLGSALIVSEEDTSHYNQIKGRDMYAYFRNNDVYLLDVMANVQTVFFRADEEDSTLVDINFAESTNMKVFLENRKVWRVAYYDHVKDDMHALDDVPRERQRLKGFVWHAAIRPVTRYDVCDRKIKPSQRAATELIVRPTFPITIKIDNL